jgi:hypothetical protein
VRTPVDVIVGRLPKVLPNLPSREGASETRSIYPHLWHSASNVNAIPFPKSDDGQVVEVKPILHAP